MPELMDNLEKNYKAWEDQGSVENVWSFPVLIFILSVANNILEWNFNLCKLFVSGSIEVDDFEPL